MNDTETNERIARALVWRKVFVDGDLWQQGFTFCALPDYLHDLNAAHEIVEHMGGKGFSFGAHRSSLDGTWTTRFVSVEGEHCGDGHDLSAAIVAAFCKYLDSVK